MEKELQRCFSGFQNKEIYDFGEKKSNKGKDTNQVSSKQFYIVNILYIRKLGKKAQTNQLGELFSKIQLLMSKYEIFRNLCYTSLLFTMEGTKNYICFKNKHLKQKPKINVLPIPQLNAGTRALEIGCDQFFISGGHQNERRFTRFSLFKNEVLEEECSTSHTQHGLILFKNIIFILTGNKEGYCRTDKCEI